MTDDEQLQQWETDGGLAVPQDRESMHDFAVRDVQGNQYNIESQKVRK